MEKLLMDENHVRFEFRFIDDVQDIEMNETTTLFSGIVENDIYLWHEVFIKLLRTVGYSDSAIYKIMRKEEEIED